MKNHCSFQNRHRSKPETITRRSFLNTVGLSVAGMMVSSNILANKLKLLAGISSGNYLTQVAATQSDTYDSQFIRGRVEHLFDSLGGISDVVGPGDKVAIKINLTGGSAWVNDPNLNGVDIRECAWTHPEVLRAVGELLIDAGVNPADLFIVEALWDYSCYQDYGYQEVQQYLGAGMVNLNQASPYSGFASISTGPDHFYYDSFTLNRILDEVDAFVSIPKMKQHYEAGVTHSMKNLVGITPLSLYQIPSQQGYRSAIHYEGGAIGYHLPRSICDLNMARPVNLAVIDGVKNAIGGEGPWNETFEPYESGLLLAGKDSVATDSIASYVMGNDPEAPTLQRPAGGTCDNHLYLAAGIGMGINELAEIQLVGDAAGVIGVDEHGVSYEDPTRVRLAQNYPNPVTEKTRIHFYLPREGQASMTVFDHAGKQVEQLFDRYYPVGGHEVELNTGHLKDGMYYYQLTINGYSYTRKMIIKR